MPRNPNLPIPPSSPTPQLPCSTSFPLDFNLGPLPTSTRREHLETTALTALQTLRHVQRKSGKSPRGQLIRSDAVLNFVSSAVRHDRTLARLGTDEGTRAAIEKTILMYETLSSRRQLPEPPRNVRLGIYRILAQELLYNSEKLQVKPALVSTHTVLSSNPIGDILDEEEFASFRERPHLVVQQLQTTREDLRERLRRLRALETDLLSEQKYSEFHSVRHVIQNAVYRHTDPRAYLDELSLTMKELSSRADVSPGLKQPWVLRNVCITHHGHESEVLSRLQKEHDRIMSSEELSVFHEFPHRLIDHLVRNPRDGFQAAVRCVARFDEITCDPNFKLFWQRRAEILSALVLYGTDGGSEFLLRVTKEVREIRDDPEFSWCKVESDAYLTEVALSCRGEFKSALRTIASLLEKIDTEPSFASLKGCRSRMKQKILDNIKDPIPALEREALLRGGSV